MTKKTKTARRQFLRKLCLGFPFLAMNPLLVGCDPEPVTPNTGNPKKIVIIGAGIAGLEAARLLMAQGHEIVIYEASNTIGGRIQTAYPFGPNVPIHTGAEEVHGEKSDWYNLLINNNITLVEEDSYDYFKINNVFKREDEWTNNALYQRFISVRNQIENYNSGISKTLSAFFDENNVEAQIRPILNAEIANESGTDAGKLDLQGYVTQEELWTAGEKNFTLTQSNFASILNSVFSGVIPKVQLNQAVKTINTNSQRISIILENGTIDLCDRVLVTVPLGVLKSGNLLFEPILPAAKKAAIEKLGFDAGMKIFLEFDSPFWEAETGSIFGDARIPEFWTNSHLTKPILTGFVMGENAASLSALGTNAINIAVQDLDAYYGNGLATEHFVSGYIEDWSKKPYVLGAYSFPSIEGGLAERFELAKSVNNKLFFAGEATNTKGHASTVHGAYETGKTAANDILNSL